ncbi:hypothetical protein V3N99_15210 [Dermatophilaceae bacterium Soc4.6]
MTATTTDRHHLSTQTSSEAFLAEVRVQWASATSQLQDAAARGDDAAQQDANDRLEELRELLWHQDLSLDVLRRDTVR